MNTVAYVRVSTGSQNLANQKLAILEHARQKHFAVDRFVEVQASSRQGRNQRHTDELLDSLAAGDRLVVSEQFSVPEPLLDEFAQEAGRRFGFKKGSKSHLFLAIWEEYKTSRTS